MNMRKMWGLACCTGLWVALLPHAALADTPAAVAPAKTFYTILTPDGPMQVEMPVPSRRVQPPPQPRVEPKPSTETKPRIEMRDSSVTAGADAAPAQPPSISSSTPPAAPTVTTPAVVAAEVPSSPFFEFGGQQYVDSAYLEQREFNLEGRKRFYSVPDGLGGIQVIERESGVRLSNFTPQIERPRAVSLAPTYRRVNASTLIDLTSQQCLSTKQLKTAKPLDEKPVDFWPRAGFEPKFEFVLAELAESLQNIHLMSYTATSRRPSYYWPLPIFLDQRGCILEGVAGFYQSKTPATWLQQSALQGHLAVPQDARYLLLTPLVEAAELAGETLSDQGQLRLTPLHVAAP